MKCILSEPGWGNLVIEDTETGEVSFQCVCGGIGMYYQRVVLTPEEAAEVRDGSFDADRMVHEVCKRTARVQDRLVAPFPTEDLVKKPGG
jgi:hypothetical protein